MVSLPGPTATHLAHRAVSMSKLIITPYEPDVLMDMVAVWRNSFQHGVGIIDPHPAEGLRNYFLSEVLPNHEVRLAMAGPEVVGVLASSATSVAALYVRVDHIGQGIGSILIEIAKRRSSGSLWLYTFAQNQNARRFYKKHGFAEVAHGFEPNWQLDDVRLEWPGHTGTV